MQLFHLPTSAFALNSSYCQLSFLEVALCCEHTRETKTDVVSGDERAGTVLPVNCPSLSR